MPTFFESFYWKCRNDGKLPLKHDELLLKNGDFAIRRCQTRRWQRPCWHSTPWVIVMICIYMPAIDRPLSDCRWTPSSVFNGGILIFYWGILIFYSEILISYWKILNWSYAHRLTSLPPSSLTRFSLVNTQCDTRAIHITAWRKVGSRETADRLLVCATWL